MTFSIKIMKKVGGRSDMIASRSWSQSRITIGRGDECTLVLEDPKKHVSRVHVELEETEEGVYGVTVVSKVNPIFIGGKRQAPGSRTELGTGDRFELGDYEIELMKPPAAPAAQAAVSSLEETTRPNSALPKEPEDRAAMEQAIALGDIPPVETGIFDEPTAPAPVPVPEPEPEPTIAPAVATAQVQNVFEEATYVGAPATPTAGIYDEATYVGGRPPTSATLPLGSQALPAAVPSGADAQRMVKAFLEGAGLEGLAVPDAQAEEFMRQAGVLMRRAVEGAMSLLVARATAKKELRAEERTMVASRDNNPLKLMSDPQEAMAFLFELKERPGFLGPVQAIGDAFDDLRVHEVALIAGMRAALLGAIQRFDPKTLESELEKSAGGLGLNRKAKLWELFSQFQEKLARDADDDFNKVFGREFMGTYMAQVKRLRGQGTK